MGGSVHLRQRTHGHTNGRTPAARAEVGYHRRSSPPVCERARFPAHPLLHPAAVIASVICLFVVSSHLALGLI